MTSKYELQSIAWLIASIASGAFCYQMFDTGHMFWGRFSLGITALLVWNLLVSTIVYALMRWSHESTKEFLKEWGRSR